MRYNPLEHTDINVSEIALGTMTWGEQNTPAQAFEQMNYAIARGINFWDTAELYPAPPQANTQPTDLTPFNEILLALSELVLEKIVSVQNPYILFNRSHEVVLAEIEQIHQRYTYPSP